MKYDIGSLDNALNLLLPSIAKAKDSGVSFNRTSLLDMVSNDFFIKSLDREWNPSYDERIAYYICQEASYDLAKKGFMSFGDMRWSFHFDEEKIIMSKHFLVGQIVKASEEYVQQYHKGFWYKRLVAQNSPHVLTKKDINRGYYFTNIGSFDLSQCEVVSDEFQYYRACTDASGYDQTLLGAVTKPIAVYKYFRLAFDHICNRITTYIFIQNNLTKVTGGIYDMCLYWTGLNKDQYRTKLKTTQEGYVVGRDVLISNLSDKQKKVCFNLNEEK